MGGVLPPGRHNFPCDPSPSLREIACQQTKSLAAGHGAKPMFKQALAPAFGESERGEETAMEDIFIAICDDLDAERTNLARMVQSYARAHGISVCLRLFSSGESLLVALRGPEPIHLLFLDIYMPGLSGMETARRIRAAGSDLSIIFATTSQDHGIDSFEVRAADYLVKPFREEDVAACLDWYFSHVPERLRRLPVYSGGEWQQIPLASICYIDVYDHQSRLHTPHGVITARRGLDDLEAAIDSQDFLRCHRSFLVNLKHVEGMEGSDFRMVDQTLVPISTANTAHIRRQFIDWTYMKAWSQR